MQSSEDEKDDTLNGQGREKSRDIYTKQLPMVILPIYEQFFENTLCSETYDTVNNLYKIQQSNLKKTESNLQDMKDKNDQEIGLKENATVEDSRFK